MRARIKITLLTFFFAICGTAALVTAYLQMQADANVKPADLYAVVDRQLTDLRGGDFSRAYEVASREVQHEYNENEFAAMVRTDFSEMTQASRAEYGIVRTNGRHATMEVYLIGRYGEVQPCVYLLVREWDAWRIDGARLLEPVPPEARMNGTVL